MSKNLKVLYLEEQVNRENRSCKGSSPKREERKEGLHAGFCKRKEKKAKGAVIQQKPQLGAEGGGKKTWFGRVT